MFIYVACAGGGTSSLFCQTMVKEINEKDENLTATFDHWESIMRQKKAYDCAYDLVFAYGSIDLIKGYNAFDFGRTFDVILVAPQVRYHTPKINCLLENYPVLIRDLAPRSYGLMDGEQSCRNLLGDLIILDEYRAYQSSIIDQTKAADKNPEILILGGDRDKLPIQRLMKRWDKMGLRVVSDAYSMEELYDFEAESDYDIRVLFSAVGSIKIEDLPKLSRRIDGIVAAPIAEKKIKQLKTWLKEDQILIYQMSDEEYYDTRGLVSQQKLDDFFMNVFSKTEFSIEKELPELEQVKLNKKKSLFGFLSWTSNDKK